MMKLSEQWLMSINWVAFNSWLTFVDSNEYILLHKTYSSVEAREGLGMFRNETSNG